MIPLKERLLSESLKTLFSNLPPSPFLNKIIGLHDSKRFGIPNTRNITLRSDNMFSYCPKGKETHLNDDMTAWSRNGRQTGKIGKILRKVASENNIPFVDVDIEQTVNYCKGSNGKGGFNIVKGGEIKKWYSEDNHHTEESLGSLGDSCMRYNSCQEFFDLYIENEVELIILVDNNMLIGRALLWNGKYMDRIYGSDSTIQLFKQYAEENNFWYKVNQNYEDKQDWVHNGQCFAKDITLQLKKTYFRYYPYCDTFTYLDRETNEISNETNNGIQLTDTSGGYDDTDGVWCEEREEFIDEDDAVWYNDEYYHNEDCTWCEYEGESIPDCFVQRLYDGEYCHEDNTVQLAGGEYAHNEDDNITYCDGDDVYQNYEETFTCEHDGLTYSDRGDSIYIDELEITVHQDNEKDAFKDAGYEFIEGEWILEPVLN